VLNELGVEADNAGEPIDTTVGKPADICIGIETWPELLGPVGGATRRMLFDYADPPWRARYTQLILAPGAEMSAPIATAITDLFALVGGICAGDEAAGSGGCVTINAESEMKPLRLVFWRGHGPVRWLDGRSRGDLYGR
jgi:hypothetical protein